MLTTRLISSYVGIRSIVKGTNYLKFSNRFYTVKPKLTKPTTPINKVVKGLYEDPNKYSTILTKYGWFAIPSTHYGSKWTIANIESFIESQPQDSIDTSNIPQLQNLINEKWVPEADLSNIIKVKKLTPKEIAHQKNEELYMSQLIGDRTIEVDVNDKSSNSDDGSSKKTTKKIGFIHAWNYYVSLEYTRRGGEYKKVKLEIAEAWKKISLEEKDYYRNEYIKLLESGKEILHGKVVDREVKLKQNQRREDAKRRAKERAKAKAEAENRAEAKSQADTTIVDVDTDPNVNVKI
ncbi:uncharacterized protein RJT21DRAFT_25881 [Scheffersomyces amazonensis]|uniref:uncharacterized protein n=1 Tax=Scheffersomyces amazonensis TaxID=1078765 RepID=UPI00315D6D3A